MWNCIKFVERRWLVNIVQDLESNSDISHLLGDCVLAESVAILSVDLLRTLHSCRN